MALQLPDNYRSVLELGVAALRNLEADIERELVDAVDDPDLLLRLRDVSGLAGRLSIEWEPEMEDWWSSGYAGLNLSPLDLDLLASLIEQSGEESPYRDPISVERPHPRNDLACLRTFLTDYLSGAFNAPLGSPASPGSD